MAERKCGEHYFEKSHLRDNKIVIAFSPKALLNYMLCTVNNFSI